MTTQFSLLISAISPHVTELKVFIPSEDSFYGLCHSAKYHCKYHVETGLLHYVTLTEYQNKLADVSMVSITNLDDLQLSTTPQASDDATIGSELTRTQLFLLFTLISPRFRKIQIVKQNTFFKYIQTQLEPIKISPNRKVFMPDFL